MDQLDTVRCDGKNGISTNLWSFKDGRGVRREFWNEVEAQYVAEKWPEYVLFLSDEPLPEALERFTEAEMMGWIDYGWRPKGVMEG